LRKIPIAKILASNLKNLLVYSPVAARTFIKDGKPLPCGDANPDYSSKKLIWEPNQAS
jgi:hypothetical protein